MDRISGMMGGLNIGDLQKWVEGVNWPLGKEDLVAVLQNNGAPDEIVEKVQGADKSQFGSPEDVMSSITG